MEKEETCCIWEHMRILNLEQMPWQLDILLRRVWVVVIVGTTYEQRALPPFMEEQPYVKYKVMIPLEVYSGKIAPWFKQPGLGTQFLSKYSVEELKKLGYIVESK